MTKGVFIAGTDTDVGKTVISAGLIHVLRSNGFEAAYFKAALSGAEESENKLIPGDAKLVCETGRLEEEYENMTPYIFKEAVSPHLAAKLENNPIDRNKIIEKYSYIKGKYDYLIAEGSGGIICPLIASEGEIYTIENLIKDLGMSAVIVARAGVGTINHTVLTAKYMENSGINVKGIIINGYEDNQVCRDNAEMVERLTGLPILGRLSKIDDFEDGKVKKIRINAEEAFEAEDIIGFLDQL